MRNSGPLIWAWLLTALIGLGVPGCSTTSPQKKGTTVPVKRWAPKEMAKVSMPEYEIETKDILWVEVTRMAPKPPYKLKTFDVVSITATGLADDDHPINGSYVIQPGGLVELGAPYGSVAIAGRTTEEATNIIRLKLSIPLKREYQDHVKVSVTLEQMMGMQPISGEHIVAPDGQIQLGSYGTVYVNRLTIPEAKEAIEFKLAEYLDAPEVSVTVFAYNTKVFYLILQGAGFGDKILSFPATGNETVLDAFAEINGLDRISNAKRIWIARPSGPNCCTTQYLEVDWHAITAGGCTDTNYQIFPGDRIYVEEDKLVALDSGLSKCIAPFERVFGFALLGAQTATRFSGPVLKGGGNPTGGN